MGLSNYQLVLLDNLIYLDTIIAKEKITVGEVINTLLYADGNPDNGIFTGTILTDCYNVHSGKENSMMTLAYATYRYTMWKMPEKTVSVKPPL